MTDKTTAYWDKGYVALKNLYPKELGYVMLAKLKEELSYGGRSFETLKRGSPLLRQEAIELYGGHYSPLNSFLWGLTPTITAIVERDLQPSYSYFRIYREGDICRVHSDRYACEHSVSLMLATSDNLPWALDMGSIPVENPVARADEDFGDEPYSSVPMEDGDAVLYQGVARTHGRITPNPNRWSAHLFLHWVDRNGPYADYGFEGQPVPTLDMLELR